MAHQTASHLDTRMQECVDECLSCYATCVATIAHCLALGGKHAEADHIKLLADCARICSTSAGFHGAGIRGAKPDLRHLRRIRARVWRKRPRLGGGSGVRALP